MGPAAAATMDLKQNDLSYRLKGTTTSTDKTNGQIDNGQGGHGQTDDKCHEKIGKYRGE